MPLEDSITSKEPDGSFNEDYCMWCYAEDVYKRQVRLLIVALVGRYPAN